jgi:hypothetical protein
MVPQPTVLALPMPSQSKSALAHTRSPWLVVTSSAESNKLSSSQSFPALVTQPTVLALPMPSQSKLPALLPSLSRYTLLLNTAHLAESFYLRIMPQIATHARRRAFRTTKTKKRNDWENKVMVIW